MLIPLTEWAARRYAVPPSIDTLRRWVREGQIHPPAPQPVAVPDGDVRSSGLRFFDFLQWAASKDRDVAHTYDTERSRWVALNPMTADLWECWQAAAPKGGA